MTIDKQVFVNIVGELETYYKREFTPFVKRVWYKHLNARLTTEEFVAAVEQIVVSKEFIPTPQELVEAVKGNPESQALEDWETCLTASSRGKPAPDSLTLQGKFALRSIGGVSELGRTSQDDLRWVKKEFVSAWKAWQPTESGSALPPFQDKSVLAQGVGSEVIYQARLLSQKMSLSRRANA